MLLQELIFQALKDNYVYMRLNFIWRLEIEERRKYSLGSCVLIRNPFEGSWLTHPNVMVNLFIFKHSGTLLDLRGQIDYKILTELRIFQHLCLRNIVLNNVNGMRKNKLCTC